jgi:hypothetical protein
MALFTCSSYLVFSCWACCCFQNARLSWVFGSWFTFKSCNTITWIIYSSSDFSDFCIIPAASTHVSKVWSTLTCSTGHIAFYTCSSSTGIIDTLMIETWFTVVCCSSIAGVTCRVTLRTFSCSGRHVVSVIYTYAPSILHFGVRFWFTRFTLIYFWTSAEIAW